MFSINLSSHHILVTVCATMFLTAASSCGSSRQATAPDSTPSVETPSTRRPPASSNTGSSTSAQFNTLARSYTSWDAIEVPFKVNLTSPARLSCSGKAYMTRGKDIYLSLRVMGMEVASLYVTADSVFAAEKLGRRYVAEPIGAVLGKAQLTVSDIQDLLTGRAFIPGHGTITPTMYKDLSVTTANGAMLINPRTQPRGYEYGFLVDLAANAVTTLVVEPSGLKPVECLYSSPVKAPGIGNVNSDISISADAGKTAVSATLEWKFKDARTSGVRSARWKAPKGYTRVTAAQLLKMLKVQ